VNDTAQRSMDIANLAVGGTATAAAWLADIDVALRIGVSGLTCIYLCIAIYHRLKPKPVEAEATDRDDTQ